MGSVRDIQEAASSSQARAAFARDGFVHLSGALLPSQIEALLGLLSPLAGTDSCVITRPSRCVPGLLRSDAVAALAKVASGLLGGAVLPLFDQLVHKAPHGERPIAWHQDRAYQRWTDRPRTANFWVPLRAVSPSDGALRFGRASHLGGLAPHVPTPSADALAMARPPERIVAPDYGLGDASAHGPLTAHGAGPNLSDTPRLAYVVHFGRRTSAYPRMMRRALLRS